MACSTSSAAAASARSTTSRSTIRSSISPTTSSSAGTSRSERRCRRRSSPSSSRPRSSATSPSSTAAAASSSTRICRRNWPARPTKQGRPKLWAGNPAIHLFDVDFLERVVGGRGADSLAHRQEEGAAPRRAGAGQGERLKFERFIFDVLPLADRWTVTATTRPEEFAPLKNADGADSPATVRQAIIEQAGRWLESVGSERCRATPRERSRCRSRSARSWRSRRPISKARSRPGTRFDQPTYLLP